MFPMRHQPGVQAKRQCVPNAGASHSVTVCNSRTERHSAYSEGGRGTFVIIPQKG